MLTKRSTTCWAISSLRLNLVCLSIATFVALPLNDRASAQEIIAKVLSVQVASPIQSHSAKDGMLYRATFEQAGILQVVTGELAAKNTVHGHLFLDSDGQLIGVLPEELKRIEELSGQLFEATSPKDLAEKTLKRMPAGSKFLITDHFVVCYNTTDAFARWNVKLYESLYKGFTRFWKEKGLDLTTPRFPMIALVFESKQDYVNYASSEFEGAENTIGYYHQLTNRLASYDLTGIEGSIPPGTQVNREDLLQQILMRPQAERTVATIVHEACHQIAFNTGLQVRQGDNPLWLSEGIATFFESPDPTSSTGWGGAGKINRHNLTNLARYVPNRKPESLELLLVNDNRLRSSETSTAGYAEAWGLTYYLLKSKPKQFVQYLQSVNERGPGDPASPKQRIEMFQKCFGDDLQKFDKEFIRFMHKVR